MNPHRLHTAAELEEMDDSPDPAIRERAAREFNVKQGADSLRRQFAFDQNGLILWRLYSLYRRADLPIPDDVLALFDRFAQGLEAASGPDEIARVLMMSGGKGGAQGAARLRRSTGRLARLQHIIAVMKHQALMPRSAQLNQSLVFERVAAERGQSVAAIKKAWNEARREFPEELDRLTAALKADRSAARNFARRGNQDAEFTRKAPAWKPAAKK